MKVKSLLFVLLLALSIEVVIAKPSVEYGEQIGLRYKTLKIMEGGNIILEMSGDLNEKGLFEPDDPPYFSSDFKYLLYNQIASGDVFPFDGAVRHHEVAYCGLVNVSNGCLMARETGGFCSGEFVGQEWKAYSGIEFKLEQDYPKAKDYVSGKRLVGDEELSSLENLMRCDPPRKGNKGAYSMLLKLNYFGSGNAAFERLRLILK